MKSLLKVLLSAIKSVLFQRATEKIEKELNRAEKRIDEKLGNADETKKSERTDLGGTNSGAGSVSSQGLD